jgi:hypothetical protein
MAKFIDSEAKHDRNAGENVDSMDEQSRGSETDSSDCFVSPSGPNFMSKSNKHGKRRHVSTDDESSDEDRGRSWERKRRRDHVTRRGHSRDGRVLRELQKNSDILLTLLKRADNTEKRLRVVEDEISKASTSVSSSDATPTQSKRKSKIKSDVPSEVRVSFDDMSVVFLQLCMYVCCVPS